MRKLHWLIFGLVLQTIFIYSCKKEANQASIREDPSKLALISQTKSWLDNQKSQSQPNKAANIESLRNNLDFSKFWIEQSSGGEQLLIVPIGENFRSGKNIDTKSITDLVLILDKSGNIRKGNIVLYTPKTTSVNNVPKGTFYAIYNTGEPEASGEFKFLSVTGKWLYQLNYDNRHLVSAGRVTKKSHSATDANNAIAPNCENLYLVITYYDGDGNVTGQTVTYLGPTCQPCDDSAIGTSCPDNNDGGGGSNAPPDVHEYEVVRTVSWRIIEDVAIFDKLKAKRVATEPGGGHFTEDPKFVSDVCYVCNDSNPYNVWLRYGHTSDHSDQIANAHAWGRMQYNTTVIYPEGGKTWGVNDVLQLTADE